MPVEAAVDRYSCPGVLCDYFSILARASCCLTERTFMVSQPVGSCGPAAMSSGLMRMQ